MEKGRPNIFDYSNYREFLQDFYLHKKKQSKAFSHRVFVRLCGFSSPNFLKLVMEGKRNLGKAALKKVLSYLKLNKTERQYFEAMVHFCQAKNGSAKNKYFSDMARLHHQAKVKNIDIKQYNYLSRWHYVALRELVALDGFKEDAMWINKKLNTRLSKKSIEKIISLLIDLNLLARDESGKLVQTKPNIVCSPDVHSIAVNNYHYEMLDKASKSIEASKSKNRDISGLTISVDRETFEKIRETIKRCREEIHHLSSMSKLKKVVYQVNLQLFNLSEAEWD